MGNSSSHDENKRNSNEILETPFLEIGSLADTRSKDEVDDMHENRKSILSGGLVVVLLIVVIISFILILNNTDYGWFVSLIISCMISGLLLGVIGGIGMGLNKLKKRNKIT